MTTTTKATADMVDVINAMKEGRLEVLSSVERLVLIVVADYAGRDSACFASIAKLSKVTGLGERTVQRAVARLVELGVMVAVERPASATTRRGQVSNSYTVSVEGLPTREGCQSGTGVRAAPVSERRGTGVTVTGGGVSERHPNHPSDPPMDPPTTSRASQRGGSGADVDVGDETPTTSKTPKPKTTKAKADKPPPNPRHNEVVDHYFAAFERHRGARPCDGGRIARNVKALLGKLDGDADEALRRIDNLFADAQFSSNRTIHDLARDPDKWAVRRPALARSSAAPALQRDPPGQRSWANEVQ